MADATEIPDSKARPFKQHRAMTGDTDIDNQWAILDDFLYSAGDSLNCWFSLECLENTESRDAALEAATVSQAEVGSIAELVTKLRNDLDDVQVDVVEVRKGVTVIRLAEKPLLTHRAYALNQKVTIEFKGLLHDFVVALTKEAPSVGPITHGISSADMFEDYETRCAVSIRERSVRDALTDAIPFPKYARVLWKAKTYNLNGNPKTEVRYLGP